MQEEDFEEDYVDSDFDIDENEDVNDEANEDDDELKRKRSKRGVVTKAYKVKQIYMNLLVFQSFFL